MKKYNSFKTSFYLGLVIILLLTMILSLITINVYNYVSPKFKRDKDNDTIIETPKIQQIIIHDTIFIEKPCPEKITYYKQETPSQSPKKDSTIKDTIK